MAYIYANNEIEDRLKKKNNLIHNCTSENQILGNSLTKEVKELPYFRHVR